MQIPERQLLTQSNNRRYNWCFVSRLILTIHKILFHHCKNKGSPNPSNPFPCHPEQKRVHPTPSQNTATYLICNGVGEHGKDHMLDFLCGHLKGFEGMNTVISFVLFIKVHKISLFSIKASVIKVWHQEITAQKLPQG